MHAPYAATGQCACLGTAGPAMPAHFPPTASARRRAAGQGRTPGRRHKAVRLGVRCLDTAELLRRAQLLGFPLGWHPALTGLVRHRLQGCWMLQAVEDPASPHWQASCACSAACVLPWQGPNTASLAMARSETLTFKTWQRCSNAAAPQSAPRSCWQGEPPAGAWVGILQKHNVGDQYRLMFISSENSLLCRALARAHSVRECERMQNKIDYNNVPRELQAMPARASARSSAFREGEWCKRGCMGWADTARRQHTAPSCATKAMAARL